jgi:thiaminase
VGAPILHIEQETGHRPNAPIWKAGTAPPGAQPYRDFVNRWTTDGFRSYVGDLQSSVDRQLEASVGEQAREAEDAFLWVTNYERRFWDMAMSG